MGKISRLGALSALAVVGFVLFSPKETLQDTSGEIIITDSEEVTMQKRMRICREALSEKLDDPNSADFAVNWRTGRLADDHVILQNEFRAKNRYGALQRMSGFCEFRPTQSSEELITATYSPTA